MLKGQFISFEGCEGCGKSTQIQLTAEWLTSLGFDVCVTFEPGDGILGREIRRILLSEPFAPAPRAELLLFLADRSQHVHETILPALKEGKWVLCDRYSDSTRAYQIAGRELDASSIMPLIRFAEAGCHPDLTLWLDMDVRDSLARMFQRSRNGEEVTRMDGERVDFHQRVREGFRLIWQNEPERVFRVEADGSIDDVQASIRNILHGRYSFLT
jgi:dTMP kinase